MTPSMSANPIQKGVLYIASSPRHVDEAIVSINSLRRVMPNIPIGLISDVTDEASNVDVFIETTDIYQNLSDKVFNLNKTPFEQTIYLDTDTIVNKGLNDIFTLLDNYDIAVAFNDNREYMPGKEYPVDDIPETFPEYNSGVIGYNKSKSSKLFNKWKKTYKEYSTEGYTRDQPAFRKALYETEINIATLPSEFNCRFHYGGYVAEDVHIFHGRHPNRDDIITQINKTDDPRVFIKNGNSIEISYFREPNLVERAMAYVRYKKYRDDMRPIYNIYKIINNRLD